MARDIGKLYTYDDSKGQCSEIEMRLCKQKEVCEGVNPIDLLATEADSWVPVYDAPNEWVNVSPLHGPCTAHGPKYSPPAWGLDKLKGYAWKGVVPCCGISPDDCVEGSHCAAAKTGAPDMKNWMSSYPDRTLLSLAIPGSHDTGTYKVSGKAAEYNQRLIAKAAQSAESVPLFGGLLTKIGKTSKGTIKGLSATQELSVWDQLMSGVRYLDLRVRFADDAAKTMYLAHGLYFVLFSEVLEYIRRFITTYPTEVVIVEVATDSGKTFGHL
eukprot:gene9473-32463_t